MQSGFRPSTTTWLGVFAVYLVVTLLCVWPLLPALASSLPNDIGDPALNAWILWWNAHATPLTERWWNAPVFFPMSGALALSETLLGFAPLTTPLQAMGASPVVAYNTAFITSFLFAALSAHALAHHLTGRHDAAFIAGLAFGFNPYRIDQLPHLQVLMSGWMPLALLALHRYLDLRRRRDLLLLGAAWVMNGLTNGYYLVYFGVLAAGWILWFARGWRDRFVIAGTIAAGSVPMLPVLIGYYQRQHALHLSRGMDEIASYSADLSSILAASRLTWLSRYWTLPPEQEGALYPGLVVLALAIAGVILERRERAQAASGPIREAAWRRRLRWGLAIAGVIVAAIGIGSGLLGGGAVSVGGLTISLTRPHKTLTTAIWLIVLSLLLHPALPAAWRRRRPAMFYPIAACAMFVMALGPLPRVFGARFFYLAPYAALMQLPGGYSLRVPARFGMLMLLCLALAAAAGYVRWQAARPRRALVATLMLLIILEGWMPKMHTVPIPAPVDLSAFAPSTPVLELPMEDVFSDTTAMLRATGHGHPLVNGYSGYYPERYPRLVHAMQDRRPDAFTAILTERPLLVLVRLDRDGDGGVRAFVTRAPGARLALAAADVAVYLLK